MAKSKSKHGKHNKAKAFAAKHSVEAEEAKTIKGEELIEEEKDLEEVEEVIEAEEVEKEDEEEAEEVEDVEESDEEEDDEDEDLDDEEDDDDDEDEDDSEDSDEDDEDEDEDLDDDEDDEDDDEDEDLDDEEDDDDEDDDDEDEFETRVALKKANKKAAKKAAKAAKKEAKKVITKKAIVSEKSEGSSAVKTFFARKGDKNENILTIFRDTKIIGAIIGEIFGTGIITMIALTLGLFNPLYMILAYVGITAAIVKLSGAHLNPIVTAGMMASRRVSAIRGVIYIISQVIGAWLGFLVINGFYQAGINSGNIDATTFALPTLTSATDAQSAVEDFSFFWAFTMVEFVGAIIIAFFFARAQRVKQNTMAFSATVAAGIFIAMLIAVVVNSNFFAQQGNTFILNPAVGMMYGIFPSSADGFDALMSALMPMLVTYVVFPIIGGVLGFYLSDFATMLEGENLSDNEE